MGQCPGPFILKVIPLYTELVGRHSPYVTLTLLPFSIAFHFTLLLGHFCKHKCTRVKNKPQCTSYSLQLTKGAFRKQNVEL